MRWKQFFKPVRSLDYEESIEFMKDKTSNDFLILDVRQPNEYREGHIPGAKLIPLPELDKRLDELSPEKSTLVYCAVGGRSRIAAQMLAGKGFNNIINMSGGFKAWNGKYAFGGEDLGLVFFSNDESPEHIFASAYSLEAGLGDFYVSMASKVKNDDARDLFHRLSDIENKHQDRLFREYEKVIKEPLPREKFISSMVTKASEGGLTTREYSEMFQYDLESLRDIIGMAMSIEAQALDLYQRASEKNQNKSSKKVLAQLADEERAHLQKLGEFMETL